jgi:hypothetical protein
LGAIHLERLLGISQQDIEFSLWYMRQREWIQVLDTGQLAITVEGIDKLGSRDLALPNDRLLPESTLSSRAQSAAEAAPDKQLEPEPVVSRP